MMTSCTTVCHACVQTERDDNPNDKHSGCFRAALAIKWGHGMAEIVVPQVELSAAHRYRGKYISQSSTFTRLALVLHTGSIPPELGGLVALETLDLSDNKLTGQCRKSVLRLTGFICNRVCYWHPESFFSCFYHGVECAMHCTSVHVYQVRLFASFWCILPTPRDLARRKPAADLFRPAVSRSRTPMKSRSS